MSTSPTKAAAALSLIALGTAPAACGTMPVMSADRESGQSGLMGETFAGKNACNPDNIERPFVVEWDATDLSSFEARARNDVVFVRLDGCKLRILEGCRPETSGGYGAYRPVEWTSGTLESIDIENQGDLEAKLPLGVVSLGGRVAGGEQFKMEYFVAGTTSATREDVTRAELADNAACASATHFVYGYNLGAFALGSKKFIEGEVGGSVYGFGAGANASQRSKAEKKAGDLGVCKSDVATEVRGCKAPIRLTLRTLSDGPAPAAAARDAEETDEAKSLAGKVKASVDADKDAQALYDDAVAKMRAGDGPGCLVALDQRDRLDPRPNRVSTNNKNPSAGVRAQCLMLAGQCKVGKQIMRELSMSQSPGLSDAVYDQMVEGVAKDKCRGGKRTDRDALLHAINVLQVKGQTLADCEEALATVKKLRETVKPKGPQDYQVKSISTHGSDTMAQCFVRVNECQRAWEVWRPEEKERLRKHYPQSANQSDAILRSRFEAMATQCKGK